MQLIYLDNFIHLLSIYKERLKGTRKSTFYTKLIYAASFLERMQIIDHKESYNDFNAILTSDYKVRTCIMRSRAATWLFILEIIYPAVCKLSSSASSLSNPLLDDKFELLR